MNEQNYFKNFFFIKFLISGTKRLALIKILIFLIFLYTFVLVANLVDGSLILNNAIGLLQDYANYFYFFSFLISIYFYKILILKFLSTFSPRTTKNGNNEKSAFDFLNCVKLDSNYCVEYDSYVDKHISIILLKNSSYRKGYYFVQLLILLIFLLTSVYLPIFTDQITGNWNFSFGLFPLSFISSQIKDFIFWVILAPPLLWGISTTAIATIKICKKIDRDNRFDIRPLSPDRAGGLKQLGSLTLLLFYIVVVQFSHFFATSLILGFPISHQIIYPFYFAFTAFLFLYPINSVRAAMKNAKRMELERLMKLFEQVYQNFRLEVNKGFNKVTQKNMKELLEIKSLYKQAENMPIWPFDIDTLVKFSSIFFIPIIVFIIQLLVNADSIIYNLDKLKIFQNIK